MKKFAPYFHLATCIVAFTLPVYPRALPVLIALAALLWIVSISARETWNNLKNNKYYFFICSGLFWVYLLSMSYSANQQEGWMKIETSLSLLLFPLFLFSTFKPGEANSTEKIVRWFVYGCIASTITCFVYSLFCYLFPDIAVSNKWSDYDYKLYFFWKDRLSPFIHTTYISMYLNTAIAFLLFSSSSLPFRKRSSLLLISLFSVTVLLLSSRAGLITLGILWICIIYKTIIAEKQYASGLAILLFIAAVFTGLYFRSDEFNLRISSMFSAFSSPAVENPAIEKSLIRFKIWPVALETGLNNLPFGAGIGDASDALQAAYTEKSMVSEMGKFLNAHNQFIQTLVATGIPGLLSLLLLLLFPAYLSIKNNNQAYAAFLLIIIINFLFESMLQTQAGVVFFSFLNTVLFCSFLKK